MEETITISKVYYISLLKDAALLSFLQEYGVDNWSGYDEAKQNFCEWKEENGY